MAQETPPGLEEAVDEFVRAFNNLEWERFRGSFSNEATVFFPFADTPDRITGRARFEARFLEFFDQVRAEREGPQYLEINPDGGQVQAFGDIAIVTFHLGDAPRLNRRTLVLSNRSGRWLIEHLHAPVQTASGQE